MDNDNQDSSLFDLLACSVPFVAFLCGGATLLMSGLVSTVAEDFEDGTSSGFIFLDGSIAYIAIGIMLLGALISMLIFRKLSSRPKVK